MLAKISIMIDSSKRLGQFLRTARERKGLTLRAVEQSTQISNAYLSQLESGKIKQPSPVILYKLSEIYEVSYATAMLHAGYPLPNEDKQGEGAKRMTRSFSDLTEEEETELSEYLTFIRARRRRGTK